MNALGRFLSILQAVASHLPPHHDLLKIDAARRHRRGDFSVEALASSRMSARSIERIAKRMGSASLASVIGKVPRAAASDVSAHRQRLAQLLLGALTEERFEGEKERLTAGRLTVEDHRLGRTDTDYRVMNGGGRPIFRINIKFHGTAFERAQERVHLSPDDCFPLATYKINQALERQREEALPYVFMVLSSLGLTASSVADSINADFGWFLAVAKKFRKRDIEEAMVASLMKTQAPEFVGAIRERIAAAEFRVISASRANTLLKDKLFERVFALRQRAFNRTFPRAEIDMHFSLTHDMKPLAEFLAAVALESPQRLTVLLDRGEIA